MEHPGIMDPVRRAAAVWIVLFAAYAGTIGLHAFGTRSSAATSRTTC